MLPQGFTRVEWIESTGEQYIKLPYKPSNKTRIICEIQCVVNTSTSILVLGARQSTTKNSFFFAASANGYYVTQCGNTRYNFSPDVNTIGFMRLDKNRNITTINEQIVATTPEEEFEAPVDLVLFGANTNGSISPGKIKAKRFKVYDDDTLVYDLTPALDGEGTPGMWDDVSETFRTNDGSGTFEYKLTTKMPANYTPVSYIQSDGVSYADLNFKPNHRTRMVLDCNVLSADSTSFMFGARVAFENNNFAMSVISGNVQMQDGYANDSHIFDTACLGRHLIDKDRNTTTLDGVAHTYTESEYQSDHSMTLFALNANGTVDSRRAIMQAVKCELYDGISMARRLTPCKTDDDEAIFWDDIFGEEYPNVGSGTFVAGAETILDVVPPTGVSISHLSANSVMISWDAQNGAVQYRIYRDGDVIATTESTNYVDESLNTPMAYSYAIIAVGEQNEAISDIVKAELWGNITPALIWDRSLDDVVFAKTLMTKYINGEQLTQDERMAWDAGLRGCYNARDVNRVEYHTRELQSLLNAEGYNIQIDTSLWAKSDIMRYDDIARYLGNINDILDTFGRSSNAPPLPTIEQWIDYIAANDIEKILFVTRELIYGALAMFRRAGTFTAGNDYVTQVIRRA